MKTKSKKQLVAAIVAGLTLATAAPAFAGPFADVPAKHWAYDAVSKLAQAGIVDGYGDGTFRGDRTMTRYEMAQIVGKAMEHSDKADAEQKALIKKLSDEFAKELDSLGVRVATLEKKMGNITWSGQVRSWYEWVDDSTATSHDGTSARNTRLLLFLNAPITNDITFKGRLWAESKWGNLNGNGGSDTGADVSMDQAYLQGKNWTFGRQGIQLGQGLVYAWFPNNDGFTYTFGEDKLKLTAAAFKSNAFAGPTLNVYAADVEYKASKNLNLSLVYAKNKSGDTTGEVINTWALGGVYKMKDFTLTGEYGINDSDKANLKADHLNDSAKAWVAQLKYKNADWATPHSYGIWVGYRDAESGFMGRNGDYVWETPVGFAGLAGSSGYVMDNIKGYDVGVDYTIFKNGILTLQYFDLEDEVTGNLDRTGFVGQLRYMF